MTEEEYKEQYKKLTEKQRRFLDYFIETANCSESARKAGYSPKTAHQIGHTLISKFKKLIDYKMQSKANERIASQDEVLEYLTRVVRGEEKDTFGLEASLQDRTKCAELLGKRYGTFIEKKQLSTEPDKEFKVNINVVKEE